MAAGGQVEGALSRLDGQQREALLRLLQELTEQSETGRPDASAVDGNPIAEAAFLDGLRNVARGVVNLVRERFGSLPELIDAIDVAIASRLDDPTFPTLGILLFNAGLALLSAGVVELVFRRAMRSVIKPAGDMAPTGPWFRARALILRATTSIGATLAFSVTGVLAAQASAPDPLTAQILSTFLILTIGVPRLAVAILRFALAPFRPELRVVALSDSEARFLFVNLSSLFAIVGIGMFAMGLVDQDGGHVSRDLRFWLSLTGYIWLIAVVLACRRGIADVLAGNDLHQSVTARRVGALWPALTTVVLATHWIAIQAGISQGAEVISPLRGTLAIALIIFAPFLDTLIRGIIDTALPAMPGVQEPAAQARSEIRTASLRMGRVILAVVLVVTIAKLWGVRFIDLAADGLGAGFAVTALGAMFIAAVGYLCWEAASLYVSSLLAKQAPAATASMEDTGEGGAGGGSRTATILPLLRIVLQVSIVVLTTLLALAHLGIDITPLVAGAGVLGLAIGFGAQTLVKDVVSGVFFLLDDAFRIGEFVDAGGTLGTVEKISIRSLVLRSVTGPIHIVPYGEISKITNSSRDWVIMKLRFTVPFDTDLNKVRKIFKKIGQEIAEMPGLAPDIIEPFKSQGAADVDDVGIIIRGKFTAKPGRQFMIRREIYSRIQQAFRENGIDFARKEVRVQIPGLKADQPITPEQSQSIAAAASQVIDAPVGGA
ncbi:mechanosensitive ion channel domain-containing protein [Thalassobaculum sp.]|uniref:mechanosensitive ion channel domain-containing protein n=1 Tax=Thalassobaculum sp. TaxID=2022740 RepID=UPI0032EC7752